MIKIDRNNLYKTSAPLIRHVANILCLTILGFGVLVLVWYFIEPRNSNLSLSQDSVNLVGQLTRSGQYFVLTDVKNYSTAITVLNSDNLAVQRVLQPLIGQKIQLAGKLASNEGHDLYALMVNGQKIIEEAEALPNSESIYFSDVFSSLPAETKQCLAKHLNETDLEKIKTNQTGDIPEEKLSLVNQCFNDQDVDQNSNASRFLP